MNLKSVLALASTVLTVAVVAPAAAGNAQPGAAAPEAAASPDTRSAPGGLKTYLRVKNNQSVAVTCTAYRESNNGSVAVTTAAARGTGQQPTSASTSYEVIAGNPDLYVTCVGGSKTVTIRKSQNKLKMNINTMIVVDCNGHGTSLQCRADNVAIERA